MAAFTNLKCMSDPKPREAAVVPWNPKTPVASLGGNMVLYCRAVGWPRPSITWWRGKDMLPLSSEKFEQFRDGSLTIRLVTLRSLGPYTCQVYNGQGRATSQTIVLRALGPVYNTLAHDRDYLQYIVDPPKAPSTASPKTSAPTTLFPAVRPGQRPYWPSYHSPSPLKTTLAPTTRAFIGEALHAFWLLTLITVYICSVMEMGCRLLLKQIKLCMLSLGILWFD